MEHRKQITLLLRYKNKREAARLWNSLFEFVTNYSSTVVYPYILLAVIEVPARGVDTWMESIQEKYATSMIHLSLGEQIYPKIGDIEGILFSYKEEDSTATTE